MKHCSLLLTMLVMAICLLCCQPADKPPNKFGDPVLVRIADLQDRRMGDSLFAFFSDPETQHRRDAVLAFASIQDTTAIDRIGQLLLSDSEAAVRTAAAFALGQTYHGDAESLLLQALARESDPQALREMLEAYGRVTSAWNLDPSPFLTDSIPAAGLAWSLYRAGLRGKVADADSDLARQMLSAGRPHDCRLGAAHFFARGGGNVASAEAELIGAASDDPSPEVRMAAALALGKAKTDAALTALDEIADSDQDPRVVTNAIRSLRFFPYNRIKHRLFQSLNDRDAGISIAASEVLTTVVAGDDWIEVSALTGQVNDWRVRANVYEAALSAGQNAALAAEIESRYEKSAQPYERAALLGSLKDYPAAHAFVADVLRNADTAVVRSAAAATLAEMSTSTHVNGALRVTFAVLFRDLMLSSGDPAVLGTLAGALADADAGYAAILKDAAFLYAARDKLRLPEHNESLQAIEGAIALFEHRETSPAVANAFNHPIDWELVRTLPSGQRAQIKTSRGTIVVRLLVDEAPGSVANFVKLAQSGYFSDGVFHRVVPNFVIQGGCKRGDGWGSEDYSIRSEFSHRRYHTGSVGMASAGKDTEGTQWFITHSPTPHLDGRYTIFAEVVEGQEAVDFIQVGDRILDIELEGISATGSGASTLNSEP